MSKLTGVKKVEWANTGTTSWNDIGRIKSDSSHNPESQTEEDSAGLDIFAGEKDVLQIHSTAIANQPAMRTKSVNDDNIVDLRFTLIDGTVETKTGYSMIVSQVKYGFQTGERRYFTADFKRFLTS